MSDIKYSVVSNVDVLEAMKASSISTTASRKVDRNDSVVWDQTVCLAMQSFDPSVPRDTSKDGIKALREGLQRSMATHILSSTVIPEDGKNREGKTFKVCGKDGVPKWSSWDQTRRIWAYLGDIAKVIAYGHEGLLYPEDRKVAARCDILKKCKSNETTMEAIKRQTTLLQQTLDAVLPQESSTANGLVQGLVVNNLSPVQEAATLIGKLDVLMSSVDAEDLALIQGAMGSLAKHFE